ncbi:Trypsin-1 [Zootermopsis nevadensis]|uniref:Trypsin-1 n=1 Tax=Zootermopsis nevadensis TaxID=136037 RepID=A0A067RE29_ZOONE|nr:Trypsin-1 [Zootermopsis nevadensis]
MKQVITALSKKAASRLSLRAGSTYSNSGGTVHQVSQVIRHASYNEDTIDYDIALLKVSSAFSLGTNVQPIGLQSSSVSAGTNVVVSGWGTTSEGGSASTTLRQVTVQIVSDSSCNSAYSSYGGITARMICAGTSNGGKDACQGDSGGPLIANGNLVGIVSWGVGCARANYPGVYTKVSSLRSWIQTNAGV